MDQIDINLEHYLDIERILNAFFHETHFCLNHCILKPGEEHFPTPGCCKDKYYKKFDIDHPAFERLTAQREALYGKPAARKWVKRISPCEYHTLQGCLLDTHKSPVCLGFFCRAGIDFFRERYNIFTYDYLGIHYALEWILTGDLKGDAYEEFKDSCLDMVNKVKPV